MIKNRESIDRYLETFSDLSDALANLSEFVSSLPAPDEDGNVNLYYGQLNVLYAIRSLLGDAAGMADEFSK